MTTERMFIDRQLSDCWDLFTRKTMSYVQTVSVRLSVVTLSFDYIPKLQRSSAQGISQGASGAAALGGRDQGV